MSSSGMIAGVVRGEAGPVAGATVRVQTTEIFAVTDAQGHFILKGISKDSAPMPITAWAPGYFCGGPVEAVEGETGCEIHLETHGVSDNPGYEWISAFSVAGQDGNCENCHADPGDPEGSLLPFDEWLRDAHAGSVENPRFLSMYMGTDLAGNRSPPTRYSHSVDYGRFPMPPDPALPYYGPGYKLDFPATAGNCAACHAPVASVDDPYGVDPTLVTGVERDGVACDFCHKVWDVKVDSDTGLPLENRPGVMSYELRRPEAGHQFFAGPLDDVAPGEDTYSPLQRESRFCAPCHFGSFWGVRIYDSFGEWLASSYSDPKTGKTCQDCHMPQRGARRFARDGKGALERDPASVFSHRMPGATDVELLRNALSMTTDAWREDGILRVRINLINDRTGHHVPTDSPLRHLILLVQAEGPDGIPLAQVSGPILPDWTGSGDPMQGYYAGLPGKAFAKLLEERWTGVSPTGAYWNPVMVVRDNRIAAFATDTSVYAFEHAGREPVTVEATLLFRRAYRTLADQKGWEVPDIVMGKERLEVP